MGTSLIVDYGGEERRGKGKEISINFGTRDFNPPETKNWVDVLGIR